MGREVRKVPADWQHPQEHGRYKPLFDGCRYQADHEGFLAKLKEAGLQEAVEWYGKVDKEDYMPCWPESERTHFMMYEDTSEGTPISPAFATPEELALWLASTDASAFGGMTADYAHWLRIARGGWAPSMVMSGGIMESGVQALD